MIIREMRHRRTLRVLLALLLFASCSVPAAGQAPLAIRGFSIDPPIASPRGPARIRFEFEGAEGGLERVILRASAAGGAWRTSVFEAAVNEAIARLGPVSSGVVETTARHQHGYGRAQQGTQNAYELQVLDRAGRRSNVLVVELEVRL